MKFKHYYIAELLSEISMGPFGSNIKKECFVDSGIPVLNGSNLTDVAMNDDAFRYVTKEKADSLGRANAQRGDVVVTHRGTLGQISFIPKDSMYDRYVISQSQFRFRCNEKVIPEYLVYYFHTRKGQHDLLSNASQVGVPALARATTTFQQLEIDLPEIEEQRKIVEILEDIRRKIELNKEINKNLEQQAQAIFKEWFLDNPENNEWSTGTFSELIKSTLNGDWGKEAPTGNNTEKVYCIRGADIPEVKAGNKGKMPTRYILPKNFAAKQLAAGDIVVEISGGSPTQSTGRCTAITQSLLDRYDSGMVCTNFCKAMKPKEGYSLFIYYYWQYLYGKGVFFSYENGTTGIKNLDFSGFIETETILIPPVDKVIAFDDYCKSIFNQIFANGKQNEHLAVLRDTLLPKLMSGELDVSDIDL